MLLYLNDDIYHMILERLDKHSDVSAFMESSSSSRIRRLCFGRLLRMGVTIVDEQQLVLLCKQLEEYFVGVSQDAGQLRDLTISIIAPTANNTSENWKLQGPLPLVSALGCLTNLRRLKIKHCESLLCCDMQLVDAFAAFTTLQALHITGCGRLAYNLLTNLRSKLFEVEMECPYYFDSTYGRKVMADPIRILGQHRDTLKHVRIAVPREDILPRHSEQHPVLSENHVFPHVHTLKLDWCCPDMIQRGAIMSAFPNVRALQIGVGVANRANEYLDEFNQWEQLNHVYGEVNNLWSFALKCCVDRLDVTSDFGLLLGLACERLCVVLKDLQPRRLVVQWSHNDHHDGVSATLSELGTFLAGVDEGTLSRMSHIGFDVIVSGKLTDNPPYYAEAFSALLAGLPHVRFFALRLNVTPSEFEADYDYTEHTGVENDLFTYLSAITDEHISESWTTQCAIAAQSLEIICFVVMGHCVYTRISRDTQGELQFDEVRSEEAERLMAIEGMLFQSPSIFTGSAIHV